jgi:hypothetical protein
MASAGVDPGAKLGKVRGYADGGRRLSIKSFTQLPMEYHRTDEVTHDDIVANWRRNVSKHDDKNYRFLRALKKADFIGDVT